MTQQNPGAVTHPAGGQPPVDGPSAIADTFAGRVHVEWDATAPVTPFGQLPFFIDFLKAAGLFDAFVADCPRYPSPSAPRKRDAPRFPPLAERGALTRGLAVTNPPIRV